MFAIFNLLLYHYLIDIRYLDFVLLLPKKIWKTEQFRIYGLRFLTFLVLIHRLKLVFSK